jgi:hypothetical protein
MATPLSPPPPPRTVVFPAADEPVCAAAFDFCLDNVLRAGDALVLLHILLAEPLASSAGGRPPLTSDQANDNDALEPGAEAAARASSDALPPSDYFYGAPSAPRASLEAAEEAVRRRFLSKLADVREGQFAAAPKLVLVRAPSADPSTVARLVCELAERERAGLIVLTGVEGGGGGGGGGGMGAAAAERQQQRRRGGGGLLGGLLKGLLRRGSGGGEVVRDDSAIAGAPVGAAGRLVLRRTRCAVAVLRPVGFPSSSSRRRRRRDEEEVGEEEDEEEEEEQQQERVPDTFEVVEFGAAVAGARE